MKYEVTKVGGDVLTFETKFEMMTFVKAYAAKYHRLPKMAIDGQELDIPRRMSISNTDYLIKTISSQTYCLNCSEYENFVALVGQGDRKAPLNVSRFRESEYQIIGSLYDETYFFDENVKTYIKEVLAILTPVQRARHEAEVLTKLRWAYEGLLTKRMTNVLTL